MKATSSVDPVSPAASTSVSNPESNLRGYILMGSSLLFFAGHTLAIKYLHVEHGIHVWVSLWVRFLVGGIITAALFGPKGKLHPFRVVTRKLLVLRGLIGACGTALFYVAIPFLGAGITSLITFTFVLWSILLAAWWLREPLRPCRLMWIMLAFTGLVLLSVAGDVELHGSAPWYGYAIAWVGAVAGGVVIVLIRRLHEKETTATIFWAQCSWGLVLSLPFVFFVWNDPTPLGLILVFGNGALAAIGQLAMTAGFKHLSVGAGAGFQMATPVLTAIGGVWLLGEIMTLGQWMAAALIVLGTWRAVLPRNGR